MLTKARNNYHKLLQAKLITKTDFSVFRNKITNLIRKCKENFYQNLFTRNSGDIRKTWKLINTICNRTQSKSVEKIVHNNNTITDPLLIAETFNNFFVNIAEDLAEKLPVSTDSPYRYMKQNPLPHLTLAPVTSDECSEIISSLKNTKEHVDHIPVQYFKKFHTHFITVLCNMINCSFTHGIFFQLVSNMPLLFLCLRKAILVMYLIIALLLFFHS